MLTQSQAVLCRLGHSYGLFRNSRQWPGSGNFRHPINGRRHSHDSHAIRGTPPLLVSLASVPAWADSYSDTIEIFKAAGESSHYFGNSYGYAVFPNIGKGGIGIGGARGKGRVYEQGRYIGNTTMTQLTIGLQLGGQAYRQIIFFQDKRALDEFTSGNFEFGAQAAAVAN